MLLLDSSDVRLISFRWDSREKSFIMCSTVRGCSLRTHYFLPSLPSQVLMFWMLVWCREKNLAFSPTSIQWTIFKGYVGTYAFLGSTRLWFHLHSMDVFVIQRPQILPQFNVMFLPASITLTMWCTLFSKRSAHWFRPVLPVTPGHWPRPRVMPSLSNGPGSNLTKLKWPEVRVSDLGISEN